MPASPDGGVYAAAGNWTVGGEALYTDVTGLTVGETYTIKFFQANAGIDGITPNGEMTGWRVQFGSETQYSPHMPYLGEGNQLWQEVVMTFTATSSSQRLTFYADDDGIDDNRGFSTEYMAVDGVRVEEGDTSGVCLTDSPYVIGNGNEDTPVTINSAAIVDPNDRDVDGDDLTIISVQDPTNGTVQLVGDNVVFTPDPDYNGPASFDYTISDGNGGTDTATVTYDVVPVNDPPDAIDDLATTNEDTPIFNLPILGNDTDIDGDSLTIVGTPTSPNGTVTVNADGTINYIPDPDFEGTDTITYVISDGNGGTDTADVVVTVNPLNDPPVVLPDAATVNEDFTGSITDSLTFSDVDDAPGDLTVTTVSNQPGDNGFGIFNVDTSGNWNYDLAETDPVVQALLPGEP